MTSRNGLQILLTLIFGKSQKLLSIKWSKIDGPQKKKILNIFGNLKSGSWHFLRLSSKTKNKFSFSEDFWKSFCRISHFLRVSSMQWLYFLLFTKFRVSTVDKCFKKTFLQKNDHFLWIGLKCLKDTESLWESSLILSQVSRNTW